jgi:hypothetical protein
MVGLFRMIKNMKLDPQALNEKLIHYIQSIDPSVFGLAEIATVTVTPLSKGYQNVNFLFELDERQDKRFVIRFHPDNKNGNDKTAVEAQNMMLLKGIPIPDILHVGKPNFVDSSVIILQFVEGENINFNDLSAAQIKHLAEVMAETHGI